ncbi:MAG: hypothetical protein GX640_09905 [Fibrobacter sp.]|nr:hypothetical protein [Fibrobacter sp.]
MFKRLVVISVSVMIAASASFGAKLPKFGADIGRKANPIPNMPEIRVPYLDLQSYFGYVKPGSDPDEIIDGKKMYYLYLWIPVVVPEIGVRMVSPGNAFGKPKKGKDFVSANWSEGASDKSYFDTWIKVERAVEILGPEAIKEKAETTSWITYDYNDDSSELPANPSGSKYNSCLRITSSVSDPLKALVRGLYRIGFTTYKVGEVQGTFLAQVGSPIKLPGVVLAKDIDGILAGIEAAKEKK